MKSEISPVSDGLVEAMLKAEDGMQKLLVDEVDLKILEVCDNYVIDLGRYFSPYSQSSVLRDFRTKLEEEGYNNSLVYHQNTDQYELVISRSKN